MVYTFSQNLKFYRVRKCITLKEMAEKLRVNPMTVWRWENNQRYPNIDVVYDIARILEIDVHKLLGEDKYISYQVNDGDSG